MDYYNETVSRYNLFYTKFKATLNIQVVYCGKIQTVSDLIQEFAKAASTRREIVRDNTKDYELLEEILIYYNFISGNISTHSFYIDSISRCRNGEMSGHIPINILESLDNLENNILPELRNVIIKFQNNSGPILLN